MFIYSSQLLLLEVELHGLNSAVVKFNLPKSGSQSFFFFMINRAALPRTLKTPLRPERLRPVQAVGCLASRAAWLAVAILVSLIMAQVRVSFLDQNDGACVHTAWAKPVTLPSDSCVSVPQTSSEFLRVRCAAGLCESNKSCFSQT